MRAHPDLRTLATALETYRLDDGLYPQAVPSETGGTVISPVLTTPINYLTKLTPHRYATDGSSAYILCQPGPDEKWDITRPEQFLYGLKGPGSSSEEFLNVTFDPTNGATSRGDIWRLKDQKPASRDFSIPHLHAQPARVDLRRLRDAARLPLRMVVGDEEGNGRVEQVVRPPVALRERERRAVEGAAERSI